MRNLFPVLALTLAGLCLTLTIEWKDGQNTVRTLRAEKDQMFEGMVKAYSQADKDHAQKVRYQEALASLGYEIPTELQPTTPDGEITALED